MAKNDHHHTRPPSWTSEYRMIRDEADGRPIYVRRSRSGEEAGIIDFCANLGTATLLVYWMCMSRIHFLNLFPVIALVWISIVIHQHDSENRWFYRTVIWGIFWAMWYFNIHWVPLCPNLTIFGW